MIIKSARFLQSNTNINSLPKDDKPEYAFIGRSNVGKSSLINMLTNNGKLAKVSSMPGRPSPSTISLSTTTGILLTFPDTDLQNVR